MRAIVTSATIGGLTSCSLILFRPSVSSLRSHASHTRRYASIKWTWKTFKHPILQFESGQCFSCGEENGECGQLGYRWTIIIIIIIFFNSSYCYYYFRSNLSPGRGSLYLLTREDEPFCGKIRDSMGISELPTIQLILPNRISCIRVSLDIPLLFLPLSKNYTLWDCFSLTGHWKLNVIWIKIMQ